MVGSQLLIVKTIDHNQAVCLTVSDFMVSRIWDVHSWNLG